VRRARGTSGPLLAFALLAGCASGDERVSAQAQVDAGLEAARAGKHAEAVERFTKAVAADPEMADAYHHRACSYVRMRLGEEMQGDSRAAEDKALKDFDLALRLNPAHGKAYFNRAMIYASRAQYRAAAEDLLKACQFDERNPEPHLRLGQIYEEKFEDRGLAALEHYEKYADLGGRDPATLDKVRAWRELKKCAARAPPPAAKPPGVDDEKKAAELHEDFKRLFREGRRAEALKVLETLMSRYASTSYVRERSREFSALLGALKK
jgi:Tfp pilus assembly protein PilF